VAGLDSTNAANVVDLLARLASGGVTVMMSLHQPRPDILRLIERVTLMSKTGRVVYSGPMAAADGFFERLGHASVDRSIHVIDHMLDVVIKGSTQAGPPPNLASIPPFPNSLSHGQSKECIYVIHWTYACINISHSTNTYLQR
jgi:ABC-type multidrug transport system ATPase subunit